MPSRNRRLGSGVSWPITLTDVVDGLGEQYEFVKRPKFCVGGVADSPLAVEWVPAHSFNFGMGGYHPDVVGIHINIRPVRSADRAAVRSLLLTLALPQLRDWIARSQVATETWKDDLHTCRWTCDDEEVRLVGEWPL
ncbi:hypothetical protein [Actinomadura rudentiformis]|uniref:Uncharacterized protein n=1 Tax=Actinomadura rudentiformis TaxID=359158 RepID=A0A6H9YZC9_9ACTN|nr:hypothetical protein [Actinomadura rudentiformis]KAB2348047.1 hypothetical protein F8566_19475 [Actinomadura rudentiformis]